MKRGVPPTAPKARTGELTPPGTISRARANRASEFSVRLTPYRVATGRRALRPSRTATALTGTGSSLAGVGEPVENAQRVGQRAAVGRAQPRAGAAGRQQRGRGEDVAVAAVPAQAGHLVDGGRPEV